MHYWCLLYSSVLVKKSLQNSRGGKMMLCFRLLVCLASAGSCVLGEHECGQRPRWAILMFPHSSWGKNEENTFKHTSSITIAALNTEIVCSWGANVLFVYLFLHTDWICFTHLHSRESHKWMKYSRCILFCLQGRKASSSIRVNEGRLRSHWTGFRPHRGKYDQGGKQSSRLGPQGRHLGWIQVFLEGQGRWRQIFFLSGTALLDGWQAGWEWEGSKDRPLGVTCQWDYNTASYEEGQLNYYQAYGSQIPYLCIYAEDLISLIAGRVTRWDANNPANF